MLESDFEKRPTFIEILEKLPDYKLIKAHFLMNGDSLPVDEKTQNIQIGNISNSPNIPYQPGNPGDNVALNQLSSRNSNSRHTDRINVNNNPPRANTPSRGLTLNQSHRKNS